MGIHWSGITDGGGMGDARRCDICETDTYGPLVILHPRSLSDSKPEYLKKLLEGNE